MGIYVGLKRSQFASQRAHVRGRIAFACHALEYLDGAFLPVAYTIWRNSTFKQLMDGNSNNSFIRPRQDLTFPTTHAEIWQILDNVAKEMQLEDLLSSIIVIEGKWSFSTEIEYLGYISINNNSVWRSTYSDIEIEAYPTGDMSDILDLFWTTKHLRNALVNKFIEKLSAYKDTSMELTNITYSKGVPSATQDVSSLVALYYPQKRAFVKDFLTSYLSELKEKRDTRYSSRLKPFDVDFLVTKLLANPVFNEDLKNILDSSRVIEVPAHSVAYIGEETDSIKRAYKEISKTVFEQMAKALPKDKDITDRITRALLPREQGKFDDDKSSEED
jgi:hypothetical protein